MLGMWSGRIGVRSRQNSHDEPHSGKSLFSSSPSKSATPKKPLSGTLQAFESALPDIDFGDSSAELPGIES
eukprot:g40312.t1